ncbi:alpha/beta hydrolase [bacterium]|nr:alpha/beta hydrolase [bacterium]
MNQNTEVWVFLRGLVRESGHWGDFLQQFEKAIPGTKAIAIDLPGAGKRFSEKSPWKLSDYVRSVRADFEQLGFKGRPVHLFALSLGGMVALEWMRLYPAEIQRAVLVNTSLKGVNPFFRRLSPGAYWTVLRAFFDGSAHAREQRILRLTSAVDEWPKEELDRRDRLQADHPVTKSNAVRQILAATSTTEAGVRPVQPVLLLNSLGDRLVHPDCSRQIAERWKAPLRRHAWAGHDLPLDDPQWTLDAVAQWLSSSNPDGKLEKTK